MKKYIITSILILIVAFSFTACEDWVQDVEPQIDRFDDALLNDPVQVDFLINGLNSRYAFVFTRMVVSADLLSDQLAFAQGFPQATFPTYDDINDNFARVGEQTVFSSNTIRGFYTQLGGYRNTADLLVERVQNDIEGLSPADRDRALFAGYFHGGLARYLVGFYMADETCTASGPACLAQLGGPIKESAVINAPAMYDDQIAPLFNQAEAHGSAYQIRLLNTVRARALLYLGRYAAAYAAAQDGLEEGDAPFVGLHSTQSANEFYFAGGAGRIQVVPSPRFAQYVEDEPTEANRIQLLDVGQFLPMQDKYPERESPMEFTTWQENELMLAELEAIHGQGTVATALLRVNAVRASHGVVDYVGVLDQDFFMEERDKELFLTGNRMHDQLRFDAWHELAPITDRPVGPWRGLPIPNDERNQNPNMD